MPRAWDRSELQPRRTTAKESARLARYAARLLAATATATAMSALVAHGTSAAIIEPARAGDRAAATAPDESAKGRESLESVGETPTAPPAAETVTGKDPVAPDVRDDDGEEPYDPDEPTPTTDEPTPDQPALPPPIGGPSEPEVLTLSDDDQDLPLFTDRPLAPGQRTTRCITVTYSGGLDRTDIGMHVRASGALSSWLTLRVEVGPATSRDCAGFDAGRVVAEGSLQQLADRTALVTLPVVTAAPDVPFGLRITTELSDSVPAERAGDSAGGTFTWSTR